MVPGNEPRTAANPDVRVSTMGLGPCQKYSATLTVLPGEGGDGTLTEMMSYGIVQPINGEH